MKQPADMLPKYLEFLLKWNGSEWELTGRTDGFSVVFRHRDPLAVLGEAEEFFDDESREDSASDGEVDSAESSDDDSSTDG